MSIDDHTTKLRIAERCVLVQGAAPAAAQALASAGTLRRVRLGERLIRHGDPAAQLALVGTGHLRLWRPVAAALARIAGYRSGSEVAGEAVLGGAATHDESAEAMTEVEALLVPRDAVLELLARDPAAGEAARRLLAARHQGAEARVGALLHTSVEERLADFLLAAAERWGIPAGQGVRVDAPLTHAEIASFIGSTRETVTLALGNLRRASVIAMDRRRVIILQRDALKTVRSGSRPPRPSGAMAAAARG